VPSLRVQKARMAHVLNEKVLQMQGSNAIQYLATVVNGVGKLSILIILMIHNGLSLMPQSIQHLKNIPD